jgi:UDP-glucose 4-epimerase
MNVLVTGGSGYLGRHLVQALLQAGHAVRVLDLEPSPERRLDRPGFEFIRGSITDRTAARQAMQNIEVVYDLAWRFRVWGFYPHFRAEEEREEVLENLLGTLNVLSSALAARVQHFLFASSAVVYGPTGRLRVDEEHVCHPERTAIGGPAYGITKLACERWSLVYCQRGLPVTAFRLHGVFGQDNLGQFGRMIEQARAGEAVTAIRGAGGEFVHVQDVMKAFLLAMGNGKALGEVFNLAGTYTYREADLARYIVETTGSRSAIELVEDPLQDMVSVSIEKLRQCLGYSPEHGEFLTALVRAAVEKASACGTG